MATDPVCGMYVDERESLLKLVREGRTYYFCTEGCLEQFAAPEARRRDLARRLAVAWPLAIVAVLFTDLVRPPGAIGIALGAATIVQLYPGAPFYRGTLDAVRGRLWNMDVLIAVGTTSAYLYSAAVVLLPGRLPPAVYFDASTLILALLLTGSYLETRTRERASASLRALADLLPPTAIRLVGGAESEVASSEVRPGDLVRVRPGARFPADGRVREGRSWVSESLLTGEERAVGKSVGDRVIGGSVNGDGSLLVEATAVGSETVLAEIGRLVTEAETSRVPLQRLADRIASRFVPLVLVLALAAALFWWSVGAGATGALLAFVAVAVSACPCAFGLATPAALVVGTGRAADEGILFKGHDALERSAVADLVLTDKTGTLTEGRPTLRRLVAVEGRSESELLAEAAGLEAGSEHPIARAVREAAELRGVRPSPVEEPAALPGRGIAGRLAGRPIVLRRPEGSSEPEGWPSALAQAADRMRADDLSWSVLEEDGRPVGLLGFGDAVRPGAREAVEALARDGIPVGIVTGDNPSAAGRVARAVGIAEVHAALSPEAKLRLIEAKRAEGRRVAYVGDGINDAPALAAADLGIAIGAGSDVAKESAGVILLRSDPRGIPLALRIGRRTVGKVRGNLRWAIGYNALLIPIAAGALVPLLGLGLLRLLPIAGALAMGLSSTSVLLNSLSLRRVRL